MTTLAAWSGITENVRLGLLITGMTYRHPAVYAAEAITIDHASGGRLELAYGAAWFDKEHTELGIPFPPLKAAHRRVRGGRADRARSAHHRRLHVRRRALPGARRHPAPAAGAAAAPADLDRRVGREAHDADRGALRRRVALLGHARVDDEEVAADDRPRRGRRSRSRRRSRARRRCRSRTISTPSRRTIDAWEKAGIEYLVCGWPPEGRATVEQFARRFLSAP